MTQDNPLLDFSGLPRFDVIAPTHVRPAIIELLTRSRALVTRLTDDAVAATWDDFALPLAEGIEQLSRAWGSSVTCTRSNDIPLARRL